MTRAGMRIALQSAQQLPAFGDQQAAEAELLAFRDKRLRNLENAAATSDRFKAEYTPESLKMLERWYFELLEGDGFAALDIPQIEFEECLAMYFLETAVRQGGVRWTVDENAFVPGRYEIGVTRPLFTMYADRFSHLPRLRQNKRRQAMCRQFKQLFDPVAGG